MLFIAYAVIAGIILACNLYVIKNGYSCGACGLFKSLAWSVYAVFCAAVWPLYLVGYFGYKAIGKKTPPAPEFITTG